MTRLISQSDTQVPVPEADLPGRLRGVVTYHNPEKAYGKIHSDEVEYFFHKTVCDGKFADLVEGTPVSFTWAATEKGPRAFEVQEQSEPSAEEVEAHDTRGNR